MRCIASAASAIRMCGARSLRARLHARSSRTISVSSCVRANARAPVTARWCADAVHRAAVEAVALDLDDVQVTARNSRVVVRSGKGDLQREVPLNPLVRQVLGEWLAERMAIVTPSCKPPKPSWSTTCTASNSQRTEQRTFSSSAGMRSPARARAAAAEPLDREFGWRRGGLTTLC